MGGNQELRHLPEVATQEGDAQGKDGQSDAAQMSACVWDDMRQAKNPRVEGEIPPQLRDGANEFAANLSLANTDEQAIEAFNDFAKQHKDHNSMTVTMAVNEAMERNGVPWHVRGDNQGNIALYRNQPEYEDQHKILVESQFFKPGEDMDADFNPDEKELERLASRFTENNPEQLEPAELAREINKTLSDMKLAGAGPSDAKHALNDAIKMARQNLRVSIRSDGEVEVEKYYYNYPVAEADLLCM